MAKVIGIGNESFQEIGAVDSVCSRLFNLSKTQPNQVTWHNITTYC